MSSYSDFLSNEDLKGAAANNEERNSSFERDDRSELTKPAIISLEEEHHGFYYRTRKGCLLFLSRIGQLESNRGH